MVNRKNDRPNLIFILSDDQGSWAMNCSGTKELNTPNLNRLAKEGILFDNFFCSSPVCSPARASILTGQIPSAHGVLDFLRRGNSAHASKIAKHAEDGIEITYMEGQTSYIQDLANAGYVCGLSGKWHLGNSRLPQLGFSYWNVHAGGDGNYYSAPMWSNFNFYEPEGYVTDVITDNAIEFLEAQKSKDVPFSLNIHYTAPHAPWNRENHPIQRFDSYFNNSSFDEMPNQKIHRNHLQKHPLASLLGDTPDNRRSALSGYFTSIEEMDRNIGRVIDWLEVNNLRDNTLLIFTSDNGMSMGHHGIWGKGNGTYPPNMFDTAIKVPTIISQPGIVPQNIVSDDLLSQYDFTPTILEYLGLDFTLSEKMPGKSFSSLLKGESFDSSNHICVFDEYGPTRMIRTKKWKYVHRYASGPYPSGPHELYNLELDPGEETNLMERPENLPQARELLTMLEEWFDRFSEPETNGKDIHVTGRGQIGKIGDSEKPFADDLVFYYKE